MLLINSDLQASQVNTVEDGAESVFAKLKMGGTTQYFSSYYREPDSPVDHVLLLKDQLDIIKKSHKQNNKQPGIHVFGDFNYRYVDWEG